MIVQKNEKQPRKLKNTQKNEKMPEKNQKQPKKTKNSLEK